MGSSNGIDVVALHEEKIVFEALEWNSTAMTRIVLVSVNAFEHDGCPVDAD
jgi:hypothetical protein